MATATLPPEYNEPGADEPLVIDLKQPWLAALLAWLVPGLGHLYQGRTGKGLLFMACILGAFGYGMYLGDGHVVYASTPRQELRWQYFCQVGAGAVALPALVQRHRVMNRQEPISIGGDEGQRPWYAPPRDEPQATIDDSGNRSQQPNELSKWIVDLNPRFDIATVYTMIAGLLNVLVVFDAYAGPLLIRAEQRDEPSSPPAPA